MSARTAWLAREIGDRLRRTRLIAGQTQHEVADATDVKPAALSAIERGKRLPSVLTLWDLAGSLRVSVADLLPAHDPDDVSDGPTDEEGATS